MPRFFAKGDVYLWAVLSLGKIMGYFLACSLGTAQTPPAVQVKSFTKQGQQRRICKDPPLETRENGRSPGMRTCFPYLRFFPCLSWMSPKWTQAVPLCQKHCVIFYVGVVAVKLWYVTPFFIIIFLFECFKNLLSLWIC